MKKEQQRLLFLSSLGGVLEFYDFIIYAIFAPYIASNFFPVTNVFISLLVAFGTYAIGYLVRPIGGIVFGHFGDRVGRKATFTFSIFIMALATLGIGCVPSYEVMGIAAPILIITLRILQGISIGGEIPGAITYVSESLPEKKGLACGIIFCALTMGIVIGSLVHAIVVSVFTETEMQQYGFRIPFIVGGVFGLLSYFLRKQLLESSEFLAIEGHHRFPIVAVLRHHSMQVISGAFLAAVCASIVTALFLFIPTYFAKVLHLPKDAYIWQRAMTITGGSLLTLVFGFIADKVKLDKMVGLLCFFIIFLAYPIFAIYAYSSLYVFAFIASAFLLGFSVGSIPSLLPELFPTAIRYSGIAISYNLGFAIFGGLTPFFSLLLVYYTKWLVAPSLYLIAVSSLAVLSLKYVAHRKNFSQVNSKVDALI